MKIASIDFETAQAKGYVGFDITEVGCVITDGINVSQFTTLCNPAHGVKFNWYVKQFVSNINENDVITAPMWPEVYTQLVEALKDVELIVYYSAFDYNAVVKACARYNLDHTILTSRMVDIYSKGTGTLKDNAERLSIEYNSHVAVEDARIALALFLDQNGESFNNISDFKTTNNKPTVYECSLDDNASGIALLTGGCNIKK